MNKVVLVTGSSRGMGKAEAYEFASKGYDVAVHCVKNENAAKEISADLMKKYNIKSFAFNADLSNEDEVASLAKCVLDKFGRVDVLVNNAGVALYSDFKDKKINDFEQTMKVNLYAPFLLTKILGSQMVENQYGKIINVSSIDATITYNAESAEYDASKAALINLTKTSSLELQPYVNVNCICPGWVETDMNKDLPQELLDYQASKTCKKRMAKPEEVAKLVAFLASDDAEFIDGQVINIDGGYKLM